MLLSYLKMNKRILTLLVLLLLSFVMAVSTPSRIALLLNLDDNLSYSNF